MKGGPKSSLRPFCTELFNCVKYILCSCTVCGETNKLNSGLSTHQFRFSGR